MIKFTELMQAYVYIKSLGSFDTRYGIRLGIISKLLSQSTFNNGSVSVPTDDARTVVSHDQANYIKNLFGFNDSQLIELFTEPLLSPLDTGFQHYAFRGSDLWLYRVERIFQMQQVSFKQLAVTQQPESSITDTDFIKSLRIS